MSKDDFARFEEESESESESKESRENQQANHNPASSDLDYEFDDPLVVKEQKAKTAADKAVYQPSSDESESASFSESESSEENDDGWDDDDGAASDSGSDKKGSNASSFSELSSGQAVPLRQRLRLYDHEHLEYFRIPCVKGEIEEVKRSA